MQIRLPVFIGLALFLASPAMAADFPFEGTWKITGAIHAPWEDPAHPMVTDDAERYGDKLVTIGKDRIDGPDLLGCGKTALSVEPLPFAGLFEGGLGVVDPANPAGAYDEAKAKTAALGLGFAAEPVPTLFHGCSEISLHLRDEKTLMFGLNNRIFTLERQ